MLFSCCFKPQLNETDLKTNGIHEHLIHKQREIQAEVQHPKPQQQTQNTYKTRQPLVINQNLQKMKEMSSSETFKIDDVSSEDHMIQQKAYPRNMRLASTQELERIKKKSDLWSEDSGSKMLFSSYLKEQQMLFTFKLIKVNVEETLPINYILQPLKYSTKIRNKPIQLSLCLIISSKSLSQQKPLIAKVVTDNHIKPIFGLVKKQEQKISKTHFQSDFIHQIIMVGKSCLRLELFDRIIISVREEKDFSSVLSFCKGITEQFQLQDMIKVTFLFPSFLTLSEICIILSKLIRKFLISQKFEHIIKYLGYQIELVESTNDHFQQCIIVSNNLMVYGQQQFNNKEFQVKLELAIGLLMIEIDSNNFKIYQNLMVNFLIDKTIIDYLKFIQFVHKQKKEFITKLEELKIFDQNQLEEIKTSKKIEEKLISPTERCITIKHRNKKRLGDLFRQYKNTKTPVEHSQKKKEWDDDLKQQDIKVTIQKNHKSSESSKQIQSSCNIFEVIDDSFVDKANLIVFSDQGEIEFNQGEAE